MDEFAIIKTLARSIDERKFPFQCSRAFFYGWECDYWAMTSGGETREFEIKISRADYFADAQKVKHKSLNGANYFYYVVPKDLIKKEEVDSNYGLIYVINEKKVEIIKKPRRLNNNQFDQWRMIAEKFYWKYRNLWREKYIDKEISREQFWTGLDLDLSEDMPTLTQTELTINL